VTRTEPAGLDVRAVSPTSPQRLVAEKQMATVHVRCCTGRALSCWADATVLQRKLDRLGPKDHHVPRSIFGRRRLCARAAAGVCSVALRACKSISVVLLSVSAWSLSCWLAGFGACRSSALVHHRPVCAQVDSCSIAALRTLNAVLSAACLACFVVTYAQLHPRLGLARCIAMVSTKISARRLDPAPAHPGQHTAES